MITTAQTLLSLACLISNKGTLDTSNIEAQLTENEKASIQSVIESGSCLPSNLEKLLEKTKSSGANEDMQLHAPSEACFT